MSSLVLNGHDRSNHMPVEGTRTRETITRFIKDLQSFIPKIQSAKHREIFGTAMELIESILTVDARGNIRLLADAQKRSCFWENDTGEILQSHIDQFNEDNAHNGQEMTRNRPERDLFTK